MKDKYFYSVKLNIKCENCDNEYIRVDNFFNSDKKSRKYYEDFYSDNEVSKIDDCEFCGLGMFPEEIINITEHKQKTYLNKLGLYINDKDRIIPTNSMQLVGLILKGTNETGIKEAVILNISEENYKRLWKRGKDLFDNGYISQYLICFLENDKCFRYARPDKNNFEKYYRLDNYMKYDNDLKTFEMNKDYYLISYSLEEILKKFDIEKTNKNIPSIDRSYDFEIS